MTTLKHKGYVAKIDVDFEAGLLHGEVVNTKAVLTFSAEKVSELMQAFKDTISDYEDWCAERGVPPERPYSGNLSLRLPPELHRDLSGRAASAGKSLNQYIVSIVQGSFDRQTVLVGDRMVLQFDYSSPPARLIGPRLLPGGYMAEYVRKSAQSRSLPYSFAVKSPVQ